jgi:hypothetical protein
MLRHAQICSPTDMIAKASSVACPFPNVRTTGTTHAPTQFFSGFCPSNLIVWLVPAREKVVSRESVLPTSRYQVCLLLIRCCVPVGSNNGILLLVFPIVVAQLKRATARRKIVKSRSRSTGTVRIRTIGTYRVLTTVGYCTSSPYTWYQNGRYHYFSSSTEPLVFILG